MAVCLRKRLREYAPDFSKGFDFKPIGILLSLFGRRFPFYLPKVENWDQTSMKTGVKPTLYA
jgi:hypothetical protein